VKAAVEALGGCCSPEHQPAASSTDCCSSEPQQPVSSGCCGGEMPAKEAPDAERIDLSEIANSVFSAQIVVTKG
jgi:hypothetical protein